MNGPTRCERFADNLAELALGILTGRERIATLDHVESCAHCADELEHLSRASDAVLRMAPDIEPPLGFEVRLWSRMGNDRVGSPRHPLKRGLLAGAAAVVALVIGLSVGLSMASSPPGTKVPASSKPLLTGNFVEDGTKVGEVSVYGGSTPVLTMELSKTLVQGRVTCEIVTDSGATEKLGTFRVTNGYGVWADPLGVAPDAVRLAKLVSPHGATIATAQLG